METHAHRTAAPSAKLMADLLIKISLPVIKDVNSERNFNMETRKVINVIGDVSTLW